MRLALIYPPSCDPTAPHLALPSLAGFLRGRGVDVTLVDANCEAWDRLLHPGPLDALRARLERRLARLERRPALDHLGQLAYLRLWRARGDAAAAPRGIEEATATLRDERRFHDPRAYAAAVATVDAALRLVGAAHAPLEVDFLSFRTPFGMTTPEEIAEDAEERNPFAGYLDDDLIPRLRALSPAVVGLSVCFPGQLTPAYAFALALRRALPGVHVTAGGPALTQLLVRLDEGRRARAMLGLDSALLFEGEHALLGLLEALDGRRPLAGLPSLVLPDGRRTPGAPPEDLAALPAPDFAGLPLGRYLSPSLVLPYDPSRGCYWNRCAFCHYGLAEAGTARYRERPVERVVEHLAGLAARHGARRFYLSHDSIAPRTLARIAEALAEAGLGLSWGTDLRAEGSIDARRAAVLRRGGALFVSLGVESAAPRVLERIDKGVRPATVRSVVRALAGAGVAVEAMCFTDFPTETAAEAQATLALLDELGDDLSLIIVGRFHLTHGSLIAREPARFALAETWQLAGDELGTGLFWREARPAKSDADRRRVERAIDRLSRRWLLRRYPWAGALSTAHTLLCYERQGPGAFRALAGAPPPPVLGDRPRTLAARFDLDRAALAEEREAEAWDELVHARRAVSRALHRRATADLPSLSPSPRRYVVQAGQEPRRA